MESRQKSATVGSTGHMEIEKQVDKIFLVVDHMASSQTEFKTEIRAQLASIQADVKVIKDGTIRDFDRFMVRTEERVKALEDERTAREKTDEARASQYVSKQQFDDLKYLFYKAMGIAGAGTLAALGAKYWVR